MIFNDLTPSTFTGAIALSDSTGKAIAAEYQNGIFVKAIDLTTRAAIVSADMTAPIHRTTRRNGKAGMFCGKHVDCDHGAIAVSGATMSEIFAAPVKVRNLPKEKAATLAAARAAKKKAAKKKAIARAM